MSKIALQGDASGTGTFTIAAPNSNSNPTLTLPTSSGTVVVTGGAQTIEFAAGTAAAPSITFTGDTNTGIFSPGADTIAFSEGGAEAMRIDSSGNVGIGTTSPQAKLDVQAVGTSAAATTLNLFNPNSSGSSAGNDLNFQMWNNASARTTYATLKSIVEGNTGGAENGSLRFLTIGSGSLTERMRIDSSGRVGIGTSSPGSYNNDGNQLVVGSGSGNQGLTISAGATSLASIFFAKGTAGSDPVKAFIKADGNTEYLAFGTANAERARISSGGTFFINNSTAINSEILNVRQSSSANLTGIAVGYGSTGGQWRSMSITSSNIMTFNNGLNEGTLSSAGAWTNASDARLKTNIRDIEYGLNTVLVAKPRHFERVDVEGTYIGFVAQELQTVVPEVVSGDPETQYGVDYGSLVAVAFKAIQELKAITDAQATRIEALEAEVAALKGQ